MSNKFRELKSKIAELDENRRDFIEQHKHDKRRLQDLQQEYSRCVANGLDAKPLEKTIKKLKSKIDKNDSVVDIYQKCNTKNDKNKLYSHNQQIKVISEKIIKENEVLAKGQIKKHQVLVDELTKIKFDYLNKVNELGKLVRENKSIIREVRTAKNYVSQEINPNTLIIRERVVNGKGIIYFTDNECLLAYKGKFNQAIEWDRRANGKVYSLDMAKEVEKKQELNI